MKILCDIYKTASKEGMYLYVSREDKLTRVPEFLLQRFAKPILVTTMLLSEKKKLAQADVLKVISEIVDNGFYLQMPSPLYPQGEPK
jgi:uncharacterized protein YcgL (UPF0745 family)